MTFSRWNAVLFHRKLAIRARAYNYFPNLQVYYYLVFINVPWSSTLCRHLILFNFRSNERWVWSTGKEKPRKEKSRKRRIPDRSEKHDSNSNLTYDNIKNVAVDAYTNNSHKAQRETNFHKQIKSKFDMGLAQSKRLKQRADILDFFGMDDDQIPVATFSSQPPGTSLEMRQF